MQIHANLELNQRPLEPVNILLAFTTWSGGPAWPWPVSDEGNPNPDMSVRIVCITEYWEPSWWEAWIQ